MKKILLVVLAGLALAIFGCTNVANTTTKTFFGFDFNETNPGVCEKIGDLAYKDTCYNVVAVNTLDPSICEKIIDVNPAPGVSQKDICFSGVANKLKNSSVCEKINDSGIKNDCFSKTG
jgi:hypothetical protein